ncbi:MAG: heavy-metal-associated domain-containing protein, partial [Limisphaerales bacterium]
MDETNTTHVKDPKPAPMRMDPILTRQIAIEGMTCDKCVQRVEKALKNKNGVQAVQVDRQKALATVVFDSSKTDIPALHDALLEAGYKPT